VEFSEVWVVVLKFGKFGRFHEDNGRWRSAIVVPDVLKKVDFESFVNRVGVGFRGNCGYGDAVLLEKGKRLRWNGVGKLG
jgi:hypothetical protein